MLSLAALMTVLAQAPVVAPEPSEADEPKWYAVWGSPIGWALWPIGLFSGDKFVLGFFQVGLTLPVTERMSLSLEAMVYGYPGGRRDFDVVRFAPAAAFSASMGPQFSFGERPLTGFFINPKLTVDIVPRQTGPGGQPVAHSELVGLDLGYQFRTTDLYVALVAGASIGYGSSADDVWSGPYFGLANLNGRDQVVVAVNLHLVRLGFRW